jgi:CRISPR-associated endoribonuclease Cas6
MFKNNPWGKRKQMMLQKIILQCKYGGEQKASYNWGSLFHGILLKSLPSDIAEMLHENHLRPFSQYVLPSSNQELAWNIGLWDAEIANHIIQAVLPLVQIELQHKATTLEVTGVQRSSQNEYEYFNQYFATETLCRRYEIEFLTPCTHKQDGSYVLFPTPELIVKSLNNRYCAFMQDVSLDAPEAMEQIAKHIHIVRYSLHSAVFYLERTKITGYMGRITVVISGTEQLARLAGALLSFAEYSGLGIKTALGMGGVRIRALA